MAVTEQTFADQIRKVAEGAGLKVLEATDNLVVAFFAFPDGRTQKVFMAPVGKVKGQTIVDLWSIVKEVQGDLEPSLANRLLRENGSRKAGYWGIEKMGEHHHLGAHHALVLDCLDADELKTIVWTLAVQADELEKELTGKDEY